MGRACVLTFLIFIFALCSNPHTWGGGATSLHLKSYTLQHTYFRFILVPHCDMASLKGPALIFSDTVGDNMYPSPASTTMWAQQSFQHSATPISPRKHTLTRPLAEIGRFKTYRGSFGLMPLNQLTRVERAMRTRVCAYNML